MAGQTLLPPGQEAVHKFVLVVSLPVTRRCRNTWNGRDEGEGGGRRNAIIDIINNNTVITNLEMDQGITLGPSSLPIRKI